MRLVDAIMTCVPSGQVVNYALRHIQESTDDEIQPTEIKMRTTVVTLFGAALLVASAIQTAAAAERHHQRKVARAPTPVSQPAGNASGVLAPSVAQSDAEYWAGRHGGGYAGH
jgi:hypothetical protein